MIRRAAVLAVAGVMIAALSASGAPWNRDKVTKRKVTLFVHDTGCAHDVEAKPAKIQKAKQEGLGLRIQNDCGIGRKVLVCVYDGQGKRANPFGACASVPPGLDLAVPFTLAAGGEKAEIDCPATTEGSYAAVVLVGDDVKAGACPASPPKERAVPAGEKTFTHRLAVEIVP